MNESANKITLSAGDLFNKTTADAAEEIQQIPISMIHLPSNTPFKPYSEEKMNDLVDSISRLGVLEPVLLRPRKQGGYEVVAGANRTEGSDLAGLETVPAIVREMDDDTAIMIMVDTNLKQRETLLPSEKAWAYRLMLEAIKRQGARTDLTSRQVVGKLETADIVGQDTGESGRQIQRYIRLTYLNEPLLNLADNNSLKFTVAVSLSYLKEEEQKWLSCFLESEDIEVSLAQANSLKKLSSNDTLTQEGLEAILLSEKPEPVKVTLKSTVLKKYFPEHTTPRQMEEYIIKLLEKAQHIMKSDPILTENNTNIEERK